MNRITEKDGEFYKLKSDKEVYGWENGIKLVQIIGQFEDLEEKIGVDSLIEFLNEAIYVLDHSGVVEGKSRKGNIIHCDFDYVVDFINAIRREIGDN